MISEPGADRRLRGTFFYGSFVRRRHGIAPVPLVGASPGRDLCGNPDSAAALLRGADAQALDHRLLRGRGHQVAQARLPAVLAGAPQAQQLVNDFFDGGTPLVAFRLLGGDIGTPVRARRSGRRLGFRRPVPSSARSSASTTTCSTRTAATARSCSARRSGPPGAARRRRECRPGDDFFSGGVPLVVQNQLEALAPDAAIKSLINGFFTIGVSEVIRQILVEPPTPTTDDGCECATPASRDVRTEPTPATSTYRGRRSERPQARVNAHGRRPDRTDGSQSSRTKAKITTDPVQGHPGTLAPPARVDARLRTLHGDSRSRYRTRRPRAARSKRSRPRSRRLNEKKSSRSPIEVRPDPPRARASTAATGVGLTRDS